MLYLFQCLEETYPHSLKSFGQPMRSKRITGHVRVHAEGTTVSSNDGYPRLVILRVPVSGGLFCRKSGTRVRKCRHSRLLSCTWLSYSRVAFPAHPKSSQNNKHPWILSVPQKSLSSLSPTTQNYFFFPSFFFFWLLMPLSLTGYYLVARRDRSLSSWQIDKVDQWDHIKLSKTRLPYRI